jgi:hypothetical protein
MTTADIWRRPILAALTGFTLLMAALAAPIALSALSPAQAQVSEEFQLALGPYGAFRQDPRFGDIWVPGGRPRGWSPYQVGHWVYTDDWGWYWVSDDDEADWGWVAYHYGRWAFDRSIGWFWVPGDEWAPAWVDWRYSDDYVGWSPLPPDELVDEYDAEPAYWVFVPPRYMTAPRLRTYFVPQQRRAAAFRASRVVNRTVAVNGRRFAVNAGIAPNLIAAATHSALPSFKVRPHVLAGTQGVSGAVQVKSDDLRGARPGGANGRTRNNAPVVQRTTTLIQPSVSAAPPALGKGESGKLGSRPPRAAQGASPASQQPPAASSPKDPGSQPASDRRPNQVAPAATPPSALPSRQEQRPEPTRPEPPREQRPPAAAPAARPAEPPQARPPRPEPAQTPPPPPPARSAPKPPPAVTRPAPPPRPVAPPPPPPPHPAAAPPPRPAAPAAKPAAPPKPPAGEKPEEKK